MTEINLKAKALDIFRNSKNTIYSMFLEPISKALHIPQDLTYGRSSLPPSPHEQTISTHLVNHVQGIGKSFWQVDGSLGGMVILCYAIKYPETFDSFVVMAPLIYIDDKGSPSKLIENIAKFLVKTSFEHLSFAKAYRGKSSNG
ncbi:4584_t:CDS:2 [Entrophospora sp. SA101]|nr:4584_t:CDS:2 [Entrophospora sp. SA101]